MKGSFFLKAQWQLFAFLNKKYLDDPILDSSFILDKISRPKPHDPENLTINNCVFLLGMLYSLKGCVNVKIYHLIIKS